MNHSTSPTNNTDADTIPSHARNGRGRQAIGFGAGIVATLAAGFILGAADARAGDLADGEATFVPITPCRLFDTRPAPDNVGERSEPLGADETMIQQVTGTNGNCDIPTDATAVALNATAVGATAPSFGTFYPADAPLPDSSNLNYGPGQAATPNKVDVKLSNDGKVAVFNKFGNVDMIGDVTGYYVDSNLEALDERVAVLGSGYHHFVAELEDQDSRRPQVYSAFGDGASNIDDTEKAYATFKLEAHRPGVLTVNSSALATGTTVDAEVRCGISLRNPLIDGDHLQMWKHTGAPFDAGQLAGTRAFVVDEPGTYNVHLTCRQTADAAGTNIANAHLTGIFVPD